MTHRIAALDKDSCLSKKCNIECIKFCPVNKDGSECIVLDGDGKALISEPLCTGCGICVKKCPFDAITILNLAEELGDEKVHQYGVNTFRLYHLPTPRVGDVVGLVGRNGVGKTSTLNIISGTLKPNLGQYEHEPDWDDILDFFSGTELKSHFKKIANGNLRVSIKPQAVYKVRDVWNGSGIDLLKKVDERSISSQLIDELNLSESISRKVSDLSGGELQRLAVAVTAAKDADMYLFDEPSSYNDVYQRLAVSKVIQGLADSGKSVFLVEHDMTFLDYLSDSIQIIYGDAGVYGVVSSVLPSRTGINVLLDGYLPGENIRFRDAKVSFDVYAPLDIENVSPPLVRYSKLIKKFPGFTLKVNSGELPSGQVVGVIGANALGKTTFMKLLAGLEKPEKGDLETVKVSYKPQYLTGKFDGDVRSLLYSIAGDKMNDPLLESDVINPLGIHRLYEKTVTNLSGGELQKVAIAMTLIQDVDVYALDEPSAFIDIEDRIVLAKAIQKFVKSRGKSALVIDHDIQLIDIVSDSLIIFTGNAAVGGIASSPIPKVEGMNKFLKDLQITYRRDVESGRPRVNKMDSRLDREQKSSGMYYYLAKNYQEANM